MNPQLYRCVRIPLYAETKVQGARLVCAGWCQALSETSVLVCCAVFPPIRDASRMNGYEYIYDGGYGRRPSDLVDPLPLLPHQANNRTMAGR